MGCEKVEAAFCCIIIKGCVHTSLMGSPAWWVWSLYWLAWNLEIPVPKP